MKKRFTDEQIVRILREAETKDTPIRELCKRHNITWQTLLPMAESPRRNGCPGRSKAERSGNRERQTEATGSGAVTGHRWPEGVQPKKMMTPSGRREALGTLLRRGKSRRKTCGYLGLSRRVACYLLRQPAKDKEVGSRLLSAAQEVPRFGYRRMPAWLGMGESRVHRMRRTMGFNILRRRPRRRRSGSDPPQPGGRPAQRGLER